MIRCSIRSVAALALAGLAIPALLGGCAASLATPEDDPLASLVAGCMKESAHFTDAWGCVQAKYAQGQISETDARSAPLLKLGDELAQQVEFRKLSDAKARQRLQAGLPRADA